MNKPEQPEVWLRGRVEGFPPLLMPVVHSLLQVHEDIERLVARVPPEQVWLRPGIAASIGFHILHTGGAIDRLFTYARGESLNDAQKAEMRAETAANAASDSLRAIATRVKAIIERAFEQLRSTPESALLEERRVGRAGMPSTTLGLLFHAAEHSTRHVGQAITTERILTAK